MTSHWKAGAQQLTNDPLSNASGLRSGQFDLVFGFNSVSTFIRQQFVSYPFHITRPFQLDPDIPELVTVYQQSSSGGVYRNETLRSNISLEEGSSANITTQAATIVHDCQGQPASLHNNIQLSEGSFLALTPDPIILFPGAGYKTSSDVTLGKGATLFLADSFCFHDPSGSRVSPHHSRGFDQLENDILLRNTNSKLMVRDSFRVMGEELRSTASPVGRWSIISNYIFAGLKERLPTYEELHKACMIEQTVAGISRLPNDAGWGIRSLSHTAVMSGALMERLFGCAVLAAFGASPRRRRK